MCTKCDNISTEIDTGNNVIFEDRISKIGIERVFNKETGYKSNSLEIEYSGYCDDNYFYRNIEIKFCPFCGKEL